MSKEQPGQLDGILRQGRLDTAADVASVRAALNALVSQVPVPADILQKPVEISGVDGLEFTIAGTETEDVILYFHSGVAAAWSILDASRRTGTTRHQES